jgi:uncharacterized protein (UPF0276 family)
VKKICGLCLRENHFAAFQGKTNQFKSFEVIFENYLFTEGERRDLLADFAKGHFVHLHGVATNIGSLDPLNQSTLRELRRLSNEVQAQILSDHLCFTRLNQLSSFELLPVPRTKKMLQHIGKRVSQIRDLVGQDFLLENISSYFEYEINEMSEIEFMLELHDKYQVRFLLDVNNLFVNSQNFRLSAQEQIEKLSPSMIGAYHLGGHEDLGSFLFDTHGTQVSPAVWSLYQKAIQCLGPHPTFLERDENIPADIRELEKELGLAKKILEAQNEF